MFTASSRYSSRLVDLSTSLHYTLLFGRVRWFVVFRDLVDLLSSLTCQYSSGITQIGYVAGFFEDNYNQTAASRSVSQSCPLLLDMLEGINQCLFHILLPPFVLEESLMEMFLKKLRALVSTMTIVHTEPFDVFLQNDANFILIVLSIATFMGNSSIPSHMRLKLSTNGLSQLWELLLLRYGGRWWRCLTGHFQQHPTQSFRNQISRHSVFSRLCSAEDLF